MKTMPFNGAGLSAFAASLPSAANLREMVAVAFLHRRKLLVAGLLPPILALAFAFALPKVYRAESDILVKTGREYLPQNDGGTSIMAPTSTKQEVINSEISLLTSPAMAGAAIAAIGLDKLYPDLSSPSSGSLMDAAIEQFQNDLRVDVVKMSNIIAMSFDAPSTTLAKNVLDTVIRVYIDKHTSVFAGSRAEGYGNSLARAMSDARKLEAERSRIKLDNGIYDIGAQRQTIITQLGDAESKLQDVLNRRARLAARLKYLKGARSQTAATNVSTSTDQSEEAKHARGALIDLRNEETALTARYGTNNPDLQRVRSQIAVMQQKVAATGAQFTNKQVAPSPVRQQIDQDMVTSNADLASMQGEADFYKAQVADRNAALQRLERADLDLRTTSLQIDSLTDSLKAMNGRYEQARAEEQTELARSVSVVQVALATASEKPVKPKKLYFAIAGVLGGILASGMLAFLLVLMNRTALTEEGAARLSGLPVLAVIPFHSGKSEPKAYPG